MQEILDKILEAKEQRQTIRLKIGERGNATISINFNMPGYPKSDSLSFQAFAFVCEELTDYLKAQRIAIDESHIINLTDEAGNICFFPLVPKGIDYKDLKNKLEMFEQNHALDRLLDVDLFDTQQQSISSNKQKSCFICEGNSALHCMRSQSHSYEELRVYTRLRLQEYLDKKQEKRVCKLLSATALWSILTEISLPGKPGLVSPDSNGSHTDMSYDTFLVSSSAISSYFYTVAKMGYRWDGENKQNILLQLRMIGLQMERDMFSATKGVNTQKGIVFLLVYALFVSANVFKKHAKFDTSGFRVLLKELNKNLVEIELVKDDNTTVSHGKKCYQTYGKELAGGIRQEVESGLSTLFDEVLPFMQSIEFSIDDNLDRTFFQNQCKRILLKIMSVNNDTNILFRSDQETLEKLKLLSLKALNHEENLDSNVHFRTLVYFCKQRHISPGGSADLLALSLFLYTIIQKFSF